MNNRYLFVIEAPGKVEHVKALIEAINFEHYYGVIATRGKLIELPKNRLSINNKLLPSSWEKINPRHFNKLSLETKKYDHVFLMMDNDFEGEFIAWQFISTIKPKSWTRLRINSLDEVDLKAAIKQQEEYLNTQMIRSVFVRRGLDRFLGYILSPKMSEGHRTPLGTVISPLCSAIDKGKFKIGTLNHRVIDSISGNHYELSVPILRKDYKKARILERAFQNISSTNAIDEVQSELNPAPRTLDCGGAISKLSQRFNLDANAVYQDMQNAYEQGKLSYIRTDSDVVNTKVLKHVRSTAYKKHIEINPSRMDQLDSMEDDEASFHSQKGHLGLHPITEAKMDIPERYLSNSDRIVTAITKMIIDGLSQSTNRRYTIDPLNKLPYDVKKTLLSICKDPKWYHVDQSEVSNNENSSTIALINDDLMILDALLRNKLGRPGTLIKFVNKIKKELWDRDKKALNSKGLEALFVAKKLCPRILEMDSIHKIHTVIENDSGSLESHEIIDKVLEILDIKEISATRIDILMKRKEIDTYNKDNHDYSSKETVEGEKNEKGARYEYHEEESTFPNN